MPRVFIALGSNLGDRKDILRRALSDLERTPGIAVRAVSRLRETDAVGGPPGAPKFLNAVAESATTLPPEVVLARLLEIEARHGRVRGERDAPRTLDLDLLAYGDAVRRTPDLTLPHPRLAERGFVLQPWAELAPDFRVPIVVKTVRELLNRLRGLRQTPKPVRSPQSTVHSSTGKDETNRGLRTVDRGRRSQ